MKVPTWSLNDNNEVDLDNMVDMLVRKIDDTAKAARADRQDLNYWTPSDDNDLGFKGGDL